MTSGPTPIGNGRFAVPGNRWDLIDGPDGTGVIPEIPAITEVSDVSVVIPFYDNQHDLDLLLAALTVQTHPRSRLQVVIADDGSPEPPRVPDLARGLDIAIVRQDHAGFRAGTARNLGVGRSDGEVIVFLDGDTVPSPDYVQRLARLPSVLPDAVVTGRRRYADLSRCTPTALLEWFTGRSPDPEVWDEPAWMTQEYQRSQALLASHPRSYKYLIGAVLGCSREMFYAVGGFDESIVGYGGEDYDFTYRAYNCGAVLAYVHEAVAWHDGRDWAARTEPAAQTGQKNREVMMLAARIPEPSMRGRGRLYPVVDVLVTAHTDGWTFGAGVVCVGSLLAHLDCAVALAGTDDSTRDLLAAFETDPRVREALSVNDIGSSYGDIGGANGGRARLHLTVEQAVLITPAFVEQITAMLDRDLGELVVSDGGRPVLSAESHRRRSRLARHPEVPAAVAGRWFASEQLELGESGLDLIAGEPELAAMFGGY